MEKYINDVLITNPDKVIFSKGKITKFDIADYYNTIGEKILPFLNNRLLSVIRCYSDINSGTFFKKHPTVKKSGIVEIFKNKNEEYFYIKNKKQLIFQVQMGTLEFHIWGSCVPDIDVPNMMVFDLDPAEDVALSKLRRGVLAIKEILDDLGLISHLKTSGGKGYHIVLSLKNFSNWDEFNKFARNIAIFMENKLPKLFTSNIRKSERKGKIFIDYLRNSKGATCVAPYSLRARENAPISFPIEWDNLMYIKPNEITIKNYKQYL